MKVFFGMGLKRNVGYSKLKINNKQE